MNSLTHWLPPPDPSGPVTCAVCGCRLTEMYIGDRRAWRHYTSLHADQDARGCRPKCIAELHGRDGRPLIVEIVPENETVVAFLVAEGSAMAEGSAA